MKCFLINLDKNPERLEYMDRQLKALGIPYERFPGVFGKGLGKAELKKCFSPFRSFCVEGRRMVPGEIGCALSHANIYKKMMAEGIKLALVLEDDVKLLPELKSALDKVEGFIDYDQPQVVMLSWHRHDFNQNPSGFNGFEKINGAQATDAYCINVKAAELIYRSNYPVVSVADRWSRWRKHLGLQMYRLWPVVAAQDRVTWHLGISEIKVERKVLRGMKKIVHKVNRVWQVFADNLFFFFIGR